MTPEKVAAEVTKDLEARLLPEVMADLRRLKNRVLDARSRLPQEYPELAQGRSSRQAVLHGDLGILAGALEEALSRARTAATGEEDEAA